MATGKSEKQQVIAFIDYENCSNLTEIALNIYGVGYIYGCETE